MKISVSLLLGILILNTVSCSVGGESIKIHNSSSNTSTNINIVQFDVSDRLGEPQLVAQAIDDSEFIVYTNHTAQLEQDFSANLLQAEGDRALLKVSSHLGAKELVRQLSQKSYVEYVEPNVVLEGENVGFKTQFVPTDPLYKSKLRSGQSASYPLEMIQAWDLGQGSERVTVAVIDTGVDTTHPDLQGQVLAGKDFRDSDEDPSDSLGHGSHVAGIIAAAMNSIGIVGLAPKVKILSLRIFGPGICPQNSPMCGSSSALLNAVDFAIQKGAKVFNLSLSTPTLNDSISAAINKALAQGIVVVAAAGNDNTTRPYYPASLSGVIGVGAIDVNKQKASFSNYGNSISVVAPGVDILSTALPSFCSQFSDCVQVNERYAQISGTSQATPYVSALAALLLSKKQELTPPQVNEIIEDTATDLGNPEFFGKGVINAFKALQSLDGTLPQIEQGFFIERVRAKPFFIQSGQKIELSVTLSGVTGKIDGYGWATGGTHKIEGNGSTVTWKAPNPGKYQIVVGVQQKDKKIYGSTSVVVFD